MRREDFATEVRRIELRRQGALSGIDSVVFAPNQIGTPQLRVFVIGKLPVRGGERIVPRAGQFVVNGDRRDDHIPVIAVKVYTSENPGEEGIFTSDGAGDDIIVLTLARKGGLGSYTLRIQESDPQEPQYDPLYNSANFSFTESCEPPGDCVPDNSCPPDSDTATEIDGGGQPVDYLAKDFLTFRQVMLDRMALLVPAWEEARTQHVPDIGITLIELLAYIGDYLSYWQDAVGTEVYLRTARRRISVRRHARLVDYRLSDGCNARTWVHCCVSEGQSFAIAPEDIAFFIPENASSTFMTFDEIDEMFPPPVVFSPLSFEAPEIQLTFRQNEIKLYSWGEREGGLPRGATSATLYVAPTGSTMPTDDDLTALGLRVGDALLLEEVLGRDTGKPADRDRSRRHIVRLTRITRTRDRLYTANGSSGGGGLPVLDVEWDTADALPFPLCLSTRGRDGYLIQDIAVARGNMILCDHGHPAEPVTFPSEGCPPALPPARAGEMSFEAISQRTPFPVPDDAALRQAASLRSAIHDAAGDLPERSERRLVSLLRRTLGGTLLNDAERQECIDLLRAGQIGAEAQQSAAEALKSIVNILVDVAGVPNDAFRVLQEITETPQGITEIPQEIAAALLDIARALQNIAGAPQEIARVLRDLAVVPQNISEALESIRQSLGGDRLLGPAAVATIGNDADALPVLSLLEVEAGETKSEASLLWIPVHDLISSGPDDRHFVAEADDEGRLRPRFGDGVNGMVPPAGKSLIAQWRQGNGTAGNIAADTLTGVAFGPLYSGGDIKSVRNPLPAIGGTDPELLDDARRDAPRAFQSSPGCAVTPDDYARLAERHPQVQKASGRLCWTGNRDEIQIAVDTLGSEQLSPALADELLRSLQPYRRIGHDIRIVPPRYVGVFLVIAVTAESNAIAEDVRRAVLREFGPGRRRDGTPARFNPDRLTFGGDLSVSGIVRDTLALPGVAAASVKALRRVIDPDDDRRALDSGLLRFGPLEIARLDNDFTDRHLGELRVSVMGGR